MKFLYKLKQDNTNKNFNRLRVQFFYEDGFASLIFLMYGVYVVAYFVNEVVQAHTEMYIWCATFFIVTMLRVALVRTFHMKVKANQITDYLVWERLHGYSTLVSGACLGTFTFLFFPGGEFPVHTTLQTVFFLAFTTGATAAYAASPRICILYMCLIAVPLSYAFVFEAGTRIDMIIAASLYLFMLVLFKSTKKIYSLMYKQINDHLYTIETYEKLEKTKHNLIKAQKEVIKQSKLATMGVMSAGVAHEINNPLAIIKGYASKVDRTVIKKGVVSHKEIEKDLNHIKVSIERISKIIRGLKALSRDGQNDDFKLESLSSLIEDSVALTENNLKARGIELIIPEISKEVEVNCRSVQITQVLSNLIINSKDALEENKDNLNSMWIKISLIEKGKMLELHVSDAGNGIPEEVVEKMMTPFYTTKEVGKGTGLGLSISRKIMKENGGNLFYDSKASNTTFILSFPKVEVSKKAA